MSFRLPTFAIVALLLTSLGCASPVPETRSELDLTGRIAVAPLNLGLELPAKLAPGADRVVDALLDYVQVRDRRVGLVESEGARKLWNAVVLELESSGAPRTLPEASRLFARRLGERADYSLLVLPSLVLREARLQGETASWDGVHRTVAVPLSGSTAWRSDLDALADRVGLRGKMLAASIHLAVFTPDGRTVSEGVGGLDLLEQVVAARASGGVAVDAVETPLADPAHLRQGVALAFEGRRAAMAGWTR